MTTWTRMMTGTNRLLLGSILTVGSLLSPRLVSAATFQLVSDSSSTNATPADNSPPCRSLAAANSVADAMGSTVQAGSIAQAQALGEDDSCNQFGRANSHGAGIFELLPGMGESLGDPVPVCVSVFGSINLQSEDGGSASYSTEVISAAVVGRAVVVAIPKRAFGIQGNDKLLDTLSCRKEITMRLGERVALSTGGTAKATINGVSAAQVTGSHEIEAQLGTCAGDFDECEVVLDSPTFSAPALGALGLLLPACGALALRRRRRHTA